METTGSGSKLSANCPPVSIGNLVAQMEFVGDTHTDHVCAPDQYYTLRLRKMPILPEGYPSDNQGIARSYERDSGIHVLMSH